jgi:hypothetical protein
MALHDHEERRLADIERQLVDEAPDLARKLANLGADKEISRFRMDSIVVMLGMYLAGVTIIVVGVQISSAVVIALGAAVTAIFPLVTGWRLWRARDTFPE